MWCNIKGRVPHFNAWSCDTNLTSNSESSSLISDNLIGLWVNDTTTDVLEFNSWSLFNNNIVTVGKLENFREQFINRGGLRPDDNFDNFVNSVG
ncbi:hypothetical protein WICPIJ_000803 [Wickerhamomyces pijperi]|uniref:Uncharacterized protein n=1 Tax=Wickerhamomyces pijperi TaxID=599730 RepID=A0A9P8QBY3_WICPI|nr:hypothetical protein WICPIJ_000803 [Wickerhamomyces pijperi]